MTATILTSPLERFTFRAMQDRLDRAARLGPSRPQVQHLSLPAFPSAAGTTAGGGSRPSRHLFATLMADAHGDTGLTYLADCDPPC